MTIDKSGTPHISAQNDRDAFYGAGYMMASHRLLQMDMTRRRALGRWAEVLGEERREDDQLARIFNWRDTGRAFAAQTQKDNPTEWGLITAWVAGVNRRIDEVLAGQAPLPEAFGKDKLDYKPEKWDDADPLIVAKMTGFGNDLTLDFELFATLAELLQPDAFAAIDIVRPAGLVYTVPPEDLPKGVSPPGAAPPPVPPPSHGGSGELDPAAGLRWLEKLHSLRSLGSNSWAIDGRFTQSKKPLLANDPHLGFDFPGILYALHIDSTPGGGHFNVEGFSLPSLPGVSLGHNDKVAWSATTAFADVMDTWEVPVLDAESQIVLGEDKIPFVKRGEKIVIKGQSNPVEIECLDVPGLGVLLPKDITPIPVVATGDALLFRWTGYDTSKPSRLTGVDLARSLDEFDAAVDQQSNLNFNMVAADATGITYRVGLDVPVRDVAGGQKPWLVLNGTDKNSLWKGTTLPREELPRGRAKERGYIVTANNDPFGFTQDGRLDDDPYYYGALFDPGFRALRITTQVDALTKKGGLTKDDMIALQTDVHEVMGDELVTMLKLAWFKVGTDPSLAEFVGRKDLEALVDLLTNKWDGRMTRDSSGAVAFFAFSHLAVEEAIKDDMGSIYLPAFDLEPIFMLKIGLLVLRGDYPQGGTLLKDSVDITLLHALSKTADYLTQRFGGIEPEKYKYSDVHVSVFKDSLGAGIDYGSLPTDGGQATINVSPSKFYDGAAIGDKWPSTQGPIARMVTTFAADGTPELYYNFPLGNIADPKSPHYKDMLDDWANGKYRKMPFTKEEIAADAGEHIEIAPK